MNRIEIPSTRVTIALHDFEVEIEDDVIDLGLEFSEIKTKLSPNNEFSVKELGDRIAQFLNERWKDKLGDNVISSSQAFKVMRPITDHLKSIKKNSDEPVL